MTRFRRLLLPAALLLLPAAAAPAGRGPCSPDFDGLRAEVEAHRAAVASPTSPAERAERRALDRVLRRLRRGSTSLAKDAATIRDADAVLDDLYPGDPVLSGHVAAALDGVRAALALDRDDLALTAGQLPPGEDRDRLLGGVAEADAAFEVDDVLPPDDGETRSTYLAMADRAVRASWRAALEGKDRRRRAPCGEVVAAREGGVLLWRADQVSIVHQSASGLFHLSAVRSRRPADDSEILLEVADFHGVGTYPLPFGTGLWRDGPFIYFDFIESGTLQVTRYEAGSGIVEGTFSFTARGCVFDCAATTVSGGTFATRRLKLF